MQDFNHLDDQMLGAFVDGQLDPAGCEAVVKAVETDPDVRERVYQLRRAKDLMKLGFAGAQAPTRRTTRPTFNTGSLKRYSVAIAASVAVAAVGFTTGMLGYYTSQQLIGGQSPATIANAIVPYEDRVVVHVSESDPKQFAAALNYIEDFLEQHQTENSRIEVIANAGGLDLLREGVSPFEHQVVSMMRDHSNVHFIACANAIRSLRNQGIEPHIIPDIPADKASIDYIIERIQDGWTYVKVDTLPEI